MPLELDATLGLLCPIDLLWIEVNADVSVVAAGEGSIWLAPSSMGWAPWME